MSQDDHDRPAHDPRDDTAPIVYTIGQRIVTKALERDMALYAAQQMAAEAERAEAENKRLRTELLYKQVLETYNRAHGQNKKITLKQICERMGVSYGALRQFRSREGKRKSQK